MMHSNTRGTDAARDAPPRRASGRVFAASVVMLLIALFFLGLSIYESIPSAQTGRQNGFLEQEDGSRYAMAGNGLAVASPRHIRLFNAAGKCAAVSDVAMSDPVCAGSSLVSVYYDMGVSGLHALYPDGSHRYADTEGGILFADVNETGLITVLMTKPGSRGTAMVFDTDLTPLFRWDAGADEPLEARTSKDDVLCVGTVSAEGSILRFFRIDQARELGRLALPGKTLLDFGFLRDGTAAAVTAEELLFIADSGELLASHSFEGSHVCAWSLQGVFACVATATGYSGGECVLTCLSPEGGILGSCGAPLYVEALSACADRLLVLFTGEESTLYTSALEELVSYQPEDDVHQVFLTAAGEAFFAGDSGVTQVDFGR